MVRPLKPQFSRFLSSDPDRLHFAAHSHHPWPDVSFDAHIQAWRDAASMMDDKWDHILGKVLPDTRELIAGVLGLADPATLTFAPNTQDLVARIFSCLDPPVRILTTDSEFRSFSRQSRRWEEAGLALVERTPAEPFDTFAERFTREAAAGVHDLIFLSQVFYDSGFVVPHLDRIVSTVPENRTFVVIDGYHGFMALPTNLGSIQDRAFYLAGGYKYAMSGEGVCFRHAPPGYGPRPVDTGWYAGFETLDAGPSDLTTYATDGSRFSGATFDPSGVYRMRAVLSWLEDEGWGVAGIRHHVTELQDRFLSQGRLLGELVPPEGEERGNFLTFRTDHAAETYEKLHAKGVITDYRGDRLRVGFGVYHDEADVERLSQTIATL